MAGVGLMGLNNPQVVRLVIELKGVDYSWFNQVPDEQIMDSTQHNGRQVAGRKTENKELTNSLPGGSGTRTTAL